MLFAGFNVAEGALLAVRGRRASARRQRRRLVDRLRDRLLRPHRHPREARHASCTSSRRTCLGRPLVRALRRRDGLLLAHAADHPHVHLAARRRRADAVLALHAAHRRSAASRGSSCSRSSASRSATTGSSWKDSLHYVDYAVAALIVLGDRLPGACGTAAAACGRRAGRRCAALRSSRSGCSRARPSCCRSPRRPTSPRCRVLLGLGARGPGRRAAQGGRGRAARGRGGRRS